MDSPYMTYREKQDLAEEFDREDFLALNNSISIFRRNGYSFGNETDPSRIPYLTYSHREITHQIQQELTDKLHKFQEMIRKGEEIATLRNFDWGIAKIEEYFLEISDLDHATPETLLNIKSPETDPSPFYSYKNKFFFFDDQTKSYYSTPWLPCSWCSRGSVGPSTNKSTAIGLYCGCQDKDDDDRRW